MVCRSPRGAKALALMVQSPIGLVECFRAFLARFSGLCILSAVASARCGLEPMLPDCFRNLHLMGSGDVGNNQGLWGPSGVVLRDMRNGQAKSMAPCLPIQQRYRSVYLAVSDNVALMIISHTENQWC